MKYTIIEDRSPYFVRFTHTGIDNVIQKCLQHIDGISFTSSFTHHRYTIDQALDILSDVPMTDELTLDIGRVSLFVTQPGHSYVAHKDGLDHRYSLNYNVKILDDKCVTSWYSDADLSRYEITNGKYRMTRDCVGFDKSSHVPLTSMTAVQGEAVLFNTEIFHDWDNSRSCNERMILTLRDRRPGLVYYGDAWYKLFSVFNSRRS